MKPKDVEGNKGIENQYPVWAGGSTSMNSFLVLGNSEREVGQGEDLSYSNSYIIYKFDPSGNVIFQRFTRIIVLLVLAMKEFSKSCKW